MSPVNAYTTVSTTESRSSTVLDETPSSYCNPRISRPRIREIRRELTLSTIIILLIIPSLFLIAKTNNMISDQQELTTIVEHIVLLKVKDGTKPEQIKSMTQSLKSLVSDIPGLLSISTGSSFVEDWMVDRTNGYNFGIYARLSSKESLRTYQDHERHLKVKQEDIVPIVEGPILAVDWESEIPGRNNEDKEIHDESDGTVTHIVLVNTHREDEDVTKDDVSQMIQQVQSLSSLDCVSSITAGEVFVEEEWMMDRTFRMTVGLRVELKSKEDLLCYAKHSKHVVVRDDYIVPIASEVLAIDWQAS